MKLSKVFLQKCIKRVEGRTKEDIINELVQILIDAGRFKPAQKGNIVKAIIERERLGSTGVGEGIAIPHAKMSMVDDFYGALGIVTEGVEWKSADGASVHFVFLFSSPEGRPQEHQALIKNIIQFVRLPNFNKFLHGAKNSKEVADLFREGETQLGL
jgi:PTS system fructose-specific IIA component/PTS system nitrogen regulatory IIA component